MANTVWQDIKESYHIGNMTTRLIMVNVALFLLIHLLYIPLYLANFDGSFIMTSIQSWVAIPADLRQLLYRPWTTLTYMFAHFSFLHLLFNMLALYTFGRILNQFLPNRKVLPIYILGGLAGALAYILLFNVAPRLSPSVATSNMVGASASIMALIVATTTISPNYSLFFFRPIPLKYFTAVFILIDIITITNSNPGGHIAHLGGALMGWFIVYGMRKGTDITLPLVAVIEWMMALPQMLFVRKRPQPKTSYRNPAPRQRHRSVGDPRHATDDSYNFQEQIDRILDKIKRSGYDSLSQEEREFLFRASKD